MNDRLPTSSARKLLSDPAIRKSLVILVSGSIGAFLAATDMGLFRSIEAWERNSGLSKYHLGELAALSIVLGIAVATFIYRRYEEIRVDSRYEAKSNGEMTPQEIWANFQYEQLEHIFRQVENAKKEWQLSLDSIRDMIILAERDGTIRRCNRAFREFLGLTYEEILRENIASLLATFGIETNGLDLSALNARFHISGKWFGVRSYPYTDLETGNTTRVVIVMQGVSIGKVPEEKIRFVWGKKGYSRGDGGKDSPAHPGSRSDIGKTLAEPQRDATRR